MERGPVGEDHVIAGEPRTFLEVFTAAARIANRRPPLALPPGLLGFLAPLARLVERWVTLPPAYTAEELRVIAGRTYFGSNARARRELGFAPRPFDEAWKATVEHELRLLQT